LGKADILVAFKKATTSEKGMLEHDLVFPHSYEVQGLPELPGSGKFDVPVLYFPPPKNRPDHNGLWLKMVPATGKSWIGVFKFLFDSPSSFSRVVSTPDPNRVCIVSGSAGYLVKVENPESWEEVVIPVLSVLSLPEHDLLVLTDFTGLAAYGRNGLLWRSPRLCWDELKIVKVTHNTIEGTGYDPTNSISNESRFAVEIRTGRSLLTCPTTFTDGKPVW
jgi:hypothetical protein